METVAEKPKQTVVRTPRKRRGGRWFLLIVVLVLIGVTIYPPAFLFVLREVLAFEAWHYGFHLSVGRMAGGVTEPIRLYDVQFSHNSDAGTTTRLEIDEAITRFDWRHLAWKRDVHVWQSLTLNGVRGRIDLPSENEAAARGTGSSPKPRGAGKAPRLVLPDSLKVSRASLEIKHYEGSVKLDDVDLDANDLESGHLSIGTLSVQEPWMTEVFSNCRGSLVLEDSKLMLADMKLADGLTIASASADLPDLLRGHLVMQFALNAFSGNVQGELKSGAREDHLEFESSGTFNNISVAQLGVFFGQDADGTINEGKFNFHGSPRELEKATFTTYFKAGNFRWGQRRWQSLVAGATYVHRRLTKLDIELKQMHNTLTLDGDMSVPGNWKEWWKTDFSFAVAAQIDDLSELSALLGPGFGDAFGKLRVDGSVRGENASFNGQLIASGSHLSFGKAPLDELQAAVKLQGNEIQVTNAELTHGDDFLRGHGVVNILGKKRYWGEVKANIADLAEYAAFLQPPIAPQPFRGGLMLDWSGDGAEGAHSGAFTVRLNRVRPLVTGSGEEWQPIDLIAEATYSPESMFFTNFAVANGQTSLASRVVATPHTLQLQSLKLMHGKTAWLAGDAQLPLNVWAAWENPDKADLWNFDTPMKVDLKFDRLQVGETLALSGHARPFNGEITGNIKSDGTLEALTATGKLAIKNGEYTSGPDVVNGVGGTLDFAGNKMTITSGTGNWQGLGVALTGDVTARDVRKPAVDIGFRLGSDTIGLGPDLMSTATFDMHARGTPGVLAISGTTHVEALEIDRAVDIASLVQPGGVGLRGGWPGLALPNQPAAYTVNIAVEGKAPVTVPPKEGSGASGKIMPGLMISGSLGAPVISGSVALQDIALVQGDRKLGIRDGVFYLNPKAPAETSVTLHITGTLDSEPVDGYVLGTLKEKRFTWNADTTALVEGRKRAGTQATLDFTPLTLDAGAPTFDVSDEAGKVMGLDVKTAITPEEP